MAVSVENIYTSVGCNRVPHSLDWGNNDLIIFGASHAVVVYDPKYASSAGRLVSTLSQHSDRVNCVRWIKNPVAPGNESSFLSTSTDKSLAVWQLDNQDPVKCSITDSLSHDAIVTVADGITGDFFGALRTVVISTTNSGKLYLWHKASREGTFVLDQTITFSPVIVLDVRVGFVPDCSVPLVACACDDGNVHLFVVEENEEKLELRKALVLTGHEDWVRVLDFTIADNGDVLLASAAQDANIRVWKIFEKVQEESNSNSVLLQSVQRDFQLKKPQNGEAKTFTCALESVLSGHENWIYGLHWQPRVLKDGQWVNPLRLLSASMDKTMIIWALEEASGLWIDQVRVGEVGGNTLGFYGCRFANRGTSILAHGYQGALHVWHHNQETNSWDPGVVCGGHFGSIEDVAWDPLGEFVITLSVDQTTRVHSPWVRANEKLTWHEIGRPQVHGHDLACLGLLDRFRFASGAEEKVVRIFAAPRNFRENLARIAQLKDVPLEGEVAEGASVPALGLSNKPVFIEDIQAQKNPAAKTSTKDDQYPEFYFTPVSLTAPPTEETLIQNTLWPEIQKLYGHGYELFSMAADIGTGILATASRAQQSGHAAIRVWDTKSWQCVSLLPTHSLTVTQMAFNRDGNLLLSVSRDRSWAVHRKTESESGSMQLTTVAKGTGGSRIIWSCDWSPDSKFFATGSRDKNLALWAASGDSFEKNAALECEDSVTAVAFGPKLFRDGGYLIAAGLDNGKIKILKFCPALEKSGPRFEELAFLDKRDAHHLTVKRLKFRRKLGTAGEITDNLQIIQLASVGADHTLKIHNLSFEDPESFTN